MSSEKTNKSFSKRLRITKKGVILRRKPGQDHFNAKQSRSKQLSQKRSEHLGIKNKKIGQFMPFK